MQYILCFLLFLLSACKDNNDLSSLQQDFVNKVFSGNIDEGPFQIRYSLRTVLFSKEIISLFGETHSYTHLPHNTGRYEGKTYCKINNKYREITLKDLFKTPEQKEFLRKFCESNLKEQSSSYYSGNTPLCTSLELKDINSFVVDDRFLIIIFQPYTVGSYVDGPYFVKIPYDVLKGHWNAQNPLASLLPFTEFISSWDEENTRFENSIILENKR